MLTALTVRRVAAAVLAAALPLTLVPPASARVASILDEAIWSGPYVVSTGEDGIAALDVTAQSNRRFEADFTWPLDGSGLIAEGTVSHETGASEGVNRVVAGIRPPATPAVQTVLRGDVALIGGEDSDLGLLVGGFVRTAGGAKGALAALHLGDDTSRLLGEWRGEVELPAVDPICAPIVATFGRGGTSLSLGDGAYQGLHGVVFEPNGEAVRGFALAASGPDGILVLTAGPGSGIDGTATLLPADGSKPVEGSFALAPAIA